MSEYIANRRLVSAVLPCLDLCEVTAGAEIPVEVHCLSEYQALLISTNDVVSWTNDIFSLDKELAAGEVNNLVLVLQQAQRLDRRQATDTVVARVIERAQQHLVAERRLLALITSSDIDASTQHALKQSMTAMRDWMAGNLAWSRTTGRYHNTTRPHQATEDILRTIG